MSTWRTLSSVASCASCEPRGACERRCAVRVTPAMVGQTSTLAAISDTAPSASLPAVQCTTKGTRTASAYSVDFPIWPWAPAHKRDESQSTTSNSHATRCGLHHGSCCCPNTERINMALCPPIKSPWSLVSTISVSSNVPSTRKPRTSLPIASSSRDTMPA